ncbi:hypothetical protein AAG906_006226 [Vitis piasezkii]
MPSPCGIGIQGLVGNQEAQHGFEQSWLKRFLDLNEMEELRNDDFQKGQRVLLYDSKLHIFPASEIKVDRSFYHSLSAFKWSSETTKLQQHRELQSEWHPSQALCGAFSLDKKEIILLDPHQV